MPAPISDAKLDELYTGRPAQDQLLSNLLYGRPDPVSRPTRKLIKLALLGKPIRDMEAIVELFFERMPSK